ncbi:MAG: maf protein [Clostridiales bacterium]|jgi:septum formation protein|nr:maf protein [Clostridiales bacterium]
MEKIILASSSPRRIEILKNLGLEFDIIPSNYKEVIVNKLPEELVCYIARNKALEVSSRVKSGNLILAADTMVFVDNSVLGKPHTKDAAYTMLRSLSGRKHDVITGICLLSRDLNKIYTDYEVTSVFFKELSDEEIWSYVSTGEPLDKAGAYGIQGFGGLFVKRIEGCYFNVVGLPIYKLYNGLREMGVNLLAKDV